MCWGKRGKTEEKRTVFHAVPGKGEILDTTVLLRTCVQSAVGMLRDQNEDLSRSTRRIKILLGLLSKENDLKGMCSLAAAGTVPGHPGDQKNMDLNSVAPQSSADLAVVLTRCVSQAVSPERVCLCPSLSLFWLQGLSWGSGCGLCSGCSSSGGWFFVVVWVFFSQLADY